MDEQYRIKDFFPGKEIFGILNRIKTGQNMPLRITLFISNFEKSFSDILSLASKDMHISEKFKNKNLILREINTEETLKEQKIKCPHCKKDFAIDEENNLNLKSYLIEFIGNNLIILISNFNRYNHNKIIKEFDNLNPLISRIFYRSSDIKQIFNKLSEKSIEVVGKDCVAKRMYSGKKTNVIYQDGTVEEFFNEARKENVWIDSIRVSITKIGELRISRRGHINYSKPFDFENFFDMFLQTIIEEIINRRDKLKDKSRKIEQPDKVNMIKLKLERNYFSDEININKLIQKLIANKDYEVGILYLSTIVTHISLFDYANGCGFDIYINSESEINIVPQTQTTENALDSLIIEINNLFDEVIK